jgi:hypothetical protein
MAKTKLKAARKLPPRREQALVTHERWIVAALLAVFAVLAWSATRDKSTTFDEMAHMTAGTAYWKTSDYRFHPENGILPQRLESLPLLLMGAKLPDTNQPAWNASDVWNFGYQFFYRLGNNLDRMLWWARGSIVLLGVLLGWIVYEWSRRLFGVVGGLVSLVACVFCPSILAHSALATSDIAATLLFVASLVTFWTMLRRVSVGTVSASAIVMGLLFVTKFSAVLILPTTIMLLVIRLAKNRPLIVVGRHGIGLIYGRIRQVMIFSGVLAVHAITVFAIIWACYGFRGEMFRDAEPGRDKTYFVDVVDKLPGSGILGRAVRFAYDHRVLPQPYLYGFAVTLEFSKSRASFLNGERGSTGWWTFFPYAFLVKTPLPTFGLMLAAAWAAVANWTNVYGSPDKFGAIIRRRAMRGLYRTAPLWVFMAIYWGVAIGTNLNIGHRHILPTYPMMFILCGAAGYWITLRAKWPTRIVAILVVLLAVESLTMYPHYLAYFNQIVGGPRYGYRHLVDSSLDWGQDLPGLKRWLDEKQDPAWRDHPVFLSYFGTGSPQYYGLDVDLLPNTPSWNRNEFFMLQPGTYCISATMLPCTYLLPWEKWNDAYEAQYQRDKKTIAEMIELQRRDPGAYERIVADPAQSELAKRMSDTLHRFDEFRFARLCAYLWRREPDDSVGHSILIYHLDANDLNAALNQPFQKW